VRWIAWILPIGVYLAWVSATWLLEGASGLLLQPEALAARSVYLSVANLFIGTLLASWAIRQIDCHSEHAGLRRIVLGISAGMTLGAAFYGLAPGGPGRLVVIINGFFQVLSVTIAEALVCWCLVGTTIRCILRCPSNFVWGLVFVPISAVLFGIYHFAHSPPYNTPGHVALLTIVGAVVSLYYALSREIYGTILFHNWLGTLGVLKSLEESSRLHAYERLQPFHFAGGVVALTAWILCDCWIRAGRCPER
jgi:hypothetical protein